MSERRKKHYRLLIALLLLGALLGSLALLYLKGEWWFPLLLRMEQNTAPELEEVEISPSSATLWDGDALAEAEGVTLTRNLMLVNGEHPLPKDYEAELVLYRGALMHPLMRDPYIRLREEVHMETGVRIYVVSDYRTAEEQEEILNSSEDGIAAEVGCSEHEAGLALDVYAPHFGGMRFLDSLSGRMVAQVCDKHGFIVRYPVDKEEVTGISYEPWHLRYVGAPHASLIMDCGMAFEEYIAFFEVGQWYRTGEYLIARLEEEKLLLPKGWERCEISPDNTGYVIVTLRYTDAQALSAMLTSGGN